MKCIVILCLVFAVYGQETDFQLELHKLRICTYDDVPMAGALLCVKDTPQEAIAHFTVCQAETNTDWAEMKQKVCDPDSAITKCMLPKLDEIMKDPAIKARIIAVRDCVAKL